MMAAENQTTASARLRTAANLIDQALELLDVSEVPCDACGSRHFMNRDHAKVFEALGRTPTKLREQANRLEGVRGHAQP